MRASCLAGAVAVVLFISAAEAPGWARPAHERKAEQATVAANDEATVSAVDLKLPDLSLVDQDGRPGAIRSGWIGDRIVVVDFIFTRCPLVCPLLTAVMADVQDRLGDAAGRDVRLLSISVDPMTDIPPRLKDYAKKYDAGPGWSFLTGDKPVVDKVLAAFGAYSANFADHAPMFLVGDAREGRWTRFFGFPTPEQIVRKVEELRAARAARAGAAAR